MVTNWRSDSTCTLLFSSCWWTYCWLSNNQTDLQLNQIFSERSEPLVDVSTQFIKAQTLMCFMLSDCCSDCAWLYTNGEICIPVIDAVHSFSLGYLDFIFTFRSSLVTLWTRVLWSGLLSLNLHPTLPESSWSRPEGARWVFLSTCLSLGLCQLLVNFLISCVCCSAGSERGCEHQQVLRRSYVVGAGQTGRGA